MAPLGLLLIFLLQFEAGISVQNNLFHMNLKPSAALCGIITALHSHAGGSYDLKVNFEVTEPQSWPLWGPSGITGHLYTATGRVAVLPCGLLPPQASCSGVSWYFRREHRYTTEVAAGKVVKSSARAARMSLDPSCGLVIEHIAAADAGLYSCMRGIWNHFVLMSVLTISQDPKKDGHVTLRCSVRRYNDLSPCLPDAIRWVNETGAVLLGDGGNNKTEGQMTCDFSLAVTPQSGYNRTFTCQVVDEDNRVKIQAEYTPDFTGDVRSGSSLWPLMYLVLRTMGLILFVVTTALVIRHSANMKRLNSGKKVDSGASERQTASN